MWLRVVFCRVCEAMTAVPTKRDSSCQARRRLGDVAIVAREQWSFADPADRTPSWLVARHGSLSPEEMHVPLLTFTS